MEIPEIQVANKVQLIDFLGMQIRAIKQFGAATPEEHGKIEMCEQLHQLLTTGFFDFKKNEE